jgi:ribonuclease J
VPARRERHRHAGCAYPNGLLRADRARSCEPDRGSSRNSERHEENDAYERDTDGGSPEVRRWRVHRRLAPVDSDAMANTLRIIPLGGLGEVGKNMTVYELGDDIVVVDAGLAFPRDEHLGVDLVLPDFSYLEGRRVLAVVLTHGHEDHVGALPYVLREMQVERVVATRLTLGLVRSKLEEHGVAAVAELVEADPEGPPLELGGFRIEFVRVAHSIPDSVSLVLETSAGRVVHTGDWKLDHTPVDGLKTDVGRLAEIGNRGVDLLLGDSTNAERPGMTGSERLVGEAFRTLMPVRKGRILVASFASNIHRMQQAADVAVECGRKVAVVGRSMRKNLNIARNLGYLSIPEESIVAPKAAMELAPHEVLILCTGSQGEPMSALTRIAYDDHANVAIERGDTVIISAKPVPGNELRVHDAINRLARAGAEVLHQEIAPVHVSGHACSEELRTMLSLLRPRAVMPIHGEYRMLAAHAQLARDAGVPSAGIVLAENGTVVEVQDGIARIVDRIEAGVTFVDGLGVGDVQDVALRDRRRLSEDGVLILVTTVALSDGGEIAPPELIARGFGEDEELLSDLREEADRVLAALAADGVSEIKLLQEHLHDEMGQLVYDRTRRRPMILPVVIEI